MSKTTNRETAPAGRGSVDHRLARLLDTPFLARVVPHLAPETLHQLVRYRGLDACGELLTCATPAQLASLLDLDLWRRPQPGRNEQFDADRFGEWLEALADTGDSAAARTVASLDAHLVIAGLSRYLRAFDPGTFEPTASTDDEPMDRNELMTSETSSDLPECEVGGYLVRARRTDGWDAIVTLLTTLDTEHHEYFHAVMQGCRRLSNSRPEIDGLDDLLTTPEQHLHDVALERERRQSRRGYATPAAARAFLQMARQSPRPTAVNPIAMAYFRAAEEDEDATSAAGFPGTPERVSQGHATDVAVPADDVSASIDAVIELLAEAGVAPQRPRALPSADEADPRAGRVPLLNHLMELVLRRDEAAHGRRSRELGFLANTLLAGCSVQSRPFTPHEATDAAACICNLGLERWSTPATLPDTFLVDHDLVAAFEVGWSILYEDVTLFVADQLLTILADLRRIDADTARGLHALRRQLATQREAGTPWLARDAADVLATLDVAAWISVLGVLDECPILPAVLTAILERRTTPVSPTAFQFISTPAQIGDIRVFMSALPGVLAAGR